MDGLIYNGSYMEFKEELKGELRKSSESFVKIGYLLKVARDTDILRTSGYRDLEDFARGEFDLDKTQVSRFIRINDRFSEGGNSDRLLAMYADFGVRKLGLMLTLPAEINEELSPDYTVGEIESIKTTYDEEQKVTPIDAYMEKQEAVQEENRAAVLAETNLLHAVIYQLCHDEKRLFEEMYTAKDITGGTDLFSVLAPGGESTHKVRIKGVGALLMVCDDRTITITNMRTLQKEVYGWGDANVYFDELASDRSIPASINWVQIYSEEWEENEQASPMQPEKKPSKVIDHTKKEKKDADTISETAVQPERREETAGSVSERTQEEPKEEAKEEQKEEPKDEPKDEPAAVIPLNPPVIEEKDNESELQTPESIQQDPLSDFSGSKEATWANMLRAHNEARKLSNHIRDTFTYEAEELGGDDIRHTRENVKKLMVQLEILISGYDEVERDLR